MFREEEKKEEPKSKGEEQEKRLDKILLVETKGHDDGGGGGEEDYRELPTELRGLRDKVFKFEEDLEAEVRSRGFSDIPVILDPSTGKAKLRMPKGPHNKVTREYAQLFIDDWKGVAAVSNSDTNVYIDPTQPGRKIYTRIPDIAFWGPDKSVNVTKRGRSLTSPLELDDAPKLAATRDTHETVNPDVVFQFSWGNAMSYEEKAIDDMMNRALVNYDPNQQHNSAPRLGYLVRIRKSAKRDANDCPILKQLEVYRIPRGTTLEDAKSNQNGASLSMYTAGQADVIIKITAQDLGIPIGTTAPRTFEIYASDLLNDLG